MKRTETKIVEVQMTKKELCEKLGFPAWAELRCLNASDCLFCWKEKGAEDSDNGVADSPQDGCRK